MAPGSTYNESDVKSNLFLAFYLICLSVGVCVRMFVCMPLGAQSGICVGCLDGVSDSSPLYVCV